MRPSRKGTEGEGQKNVKIDQKPLDLRNGKYEDRLFLQFLLLVMVPLIVMGLLSYQIYVQGETRRNRQALDSYGESVSIEYDNLFSSGNTIWTVPAIPRLSGCWSRKRFPTAIIQRCVRPRIC